MHFTIISIFPDLIKNYFQDSILKRAINKKIIKIEFINLLDFAENDERVDDKAFGGGPGMILKATPIIRAIEKAIKLKDYQVIMFSPKAKKLNNNLAKSFIKENKNKQIILICGRYEGIDERIKKIFKAKSFSIGNYILTGGELPACVLIDCLSRQMPGVLGNSDSLEENRINSKKVYSRPAVLEYNGKKYQVPKVLLSGNHKKINTWRDKN